MKFLLIFLLIVTYSTTMGYKLSPISDIDCPSTNTLLKGIPTMFLDLEKNSNVELKTCLLRDMAQKQTILLIRGYFTKKNPNLGRYRTNNDPNVIIMTKDITRYTLFSPSVRRVFSSHRSFVFILITDNKRFKCINGTMDRNDFTLLENFMNELWHEYRMMYVIISFPMSCKGKIMIYNSKRKTNHALYDRTIKLIDFNQQSTEILLSAVKMSQAALTEEYPIKSHIFYRFPTAINNCRNLRYYSKANLSLTGGFCGLDGLVMHDIVKHFKFKLLFTKDKNCFKYGYVSPDNITGSLGCIVRKQLDISFNSRFMTKYSSDDVYFIHFVKIDSLCIIVKRPGVIPIWHFVYSVYDDTLWCIIISLIIMIGVLKWLMVLIQHKLTGVKNDGLMFYIIDVFVITMFGFTLNKKVRWYLFRGICLFSSIMFIAIYQGHTSRVFTTVQRYNGIKTLDALYNSDTILYLSPSMQVFMKQVQDPDHKAQGEFMKRAQPASENYLPDFIANNSRAALLGRKQDITIEVLSEYTDKHGKSPVTIVDECLSTYYLSLIAQTGFLFYEELQIFIQRLREAGLPIIYYQWTCNMLRVPQSSPRYRNEPRTFKKIKLSHHRVAFGLLFTGQTVSLVIFLIELWRGRRNTNVCLK